MKTVDMAKENNFVLREAAKAEQMGYFDHLSAGGKCDPAEERWIEALTAGADAITRISVLESRLAQVERERDELICNHIPQTCDTCKYSLCFSFDNPCNTCNHLYRLNAVERGDTDRWEFVGVCAENTGEEN